MIRFILCVIVVVGFLILSIPILLVEWIIGKFNPMAKEISSLRSGGLSVHPVGSRGEAYGHWGRKCANGHSGSLHWKSSKLFRCTNYLPPLSHPHRLHSQERDGKGAVAFHMDEASPLPVP